ncbi:glycosyltransferase (plasmid) [Shimia sp. W99]
MAVKEPCAPRAGGEAGHIQTVPEIRRSAVVEPEVVILLALYRSARHLRAQLDSYVEQSHATWRLIVSDDSPEDDGSGAILEAFAKKHPERLMEMLIGPKQGFAQNFLSLLAAVPPNVPLVALSDQDDVWFPDKLARGAAALAEIPPGVPALYCASSVVCEEDLTPLGPSDSFSRPATFHNALVQSIGGGNTMMLNRAALDLVVVAAREAGEIVAHDWWLYQVITGCGGCVLRDPDPVLFYRQHAHNVIGANLSNKAQLERLRQLLKGRFKSWNRINMTALTRSEHHFSAEARRTLASYRAANQGPMWRRLMALRASGVYRQSRIGTLALYVACILGRL